MNFVLIALAIVCGLCGLFVLLLTAGTLLRALNPDLVAADENRPWDH